MGLAHAGNYSALLDERQEKRLTAVAGMTSFHPASARPSPFTRMETTAASLSALISTMAKRAALNMSPEATPIWPGQLNLTRQAPSTDLSRRGSAPVDPCSSTPRPSDGSEERRLLGAVGVPYPAGDALAPADIKEVLADPDVADDNKTDLNGSFLDVEVNESDNFSMESFAPVGTNESEENETNETPYYNWSFIVLPEEGPNETIYELINSSSNFSGYRGERDVDTTIQPVKIPGFTVYDPSDDEDFSRPKRWHNRRRRTWMNTTSTETTTGTTVTSTTSTSTSSTATETTLTTTQTTTTISLTSISLTSTSTTTATTTLSSTSSQTTTTKTETTQTVVTSTTTTITHTGTSTSSSTKTETTQTVVTSTTTTITHTGTNTRSSTTTETETSQTVVTSTTTTRTTITHTGTSTSSSVTRTSTTASNTQTTTVTGTGTSTSTHTTTNTGTATSTSSTSNTLTGSTTTKTVTSTTATTTTGTTRTHTTLTATSSTKTSSRTQSTSSSSSSSTFSSSSTTTATTTATWTKSTTTVTEKPTVGRLVQAELQRSSTLLVLTFDIVMNCGSPGTYVLACAAIMDDKTMALLGVNPYCSWSPYRNQLRIVLGSSSTLRLGDQVAVQTTDCQSPLIVPAVSVTSGDDAGPVVAVLFATPPRSQACSEILFSAIGSMGSVGKPLTMRWSFGKKTPPTLRSALQGELDDANAKGLAFVRIRPSRFYAAVQQLREAVGVAAWVNTTVHLELEVVVTNWLKSSDSTAASVELNTMDSELLPQIGPIGPTTFKIPRNKQVILAVQTSTPDTDECPAMVSLTGQSEAIVKWEYEASGSSEWVRTDDPGFALVDIAAAQPNVLTFAAFTFPARSVQRFRASASFPDTLANVQQHYIYYDVTITPPPPLVPVIRGPTAVDPLCDFKLETIVFQSKTLVQLPLSSEFSWTCEQPTSARCDGLSNFAKEKSELKDGSGTRGTLFSVSGGQLTPGTYIFTVTITNGDGSGEPPGKASTTVSIVGGGGPPVTLKVPWISSGQLSVQRGSFDSTAEVQASSSCEIPDAWVWRWILMQDKSSVILHRLQTNVTRAQTGSLELTTADFPVEVLVPGIEYNLALLRADSEEAMAQANSSLSTGGFRSGALEIFQSVPFVADGPPDSGMAAVTPGHGEALTTPFHAVTLGWYDEDMSGLSYAFYRFPLPETYNPSVAADGSVSVEPAFAPRAIEWEDTTSKDYWISRGGHVIRLWGTVPEVQEVSFPPGSYYVVVRVRDPLGGTSHALALGPVVIASRCNFSNTEIEAHLDRFMVTNDYEIIMNEVEAVAQTFSCVGLGQYASLMHSIAALETAVSFMDVGPGSVLKASRVIAVAVGEMRQNIDFDALSRLQGVLREVIRRMGDSLLTNVTQEDGNALLSNILTLTPGGTSSGPGNLTDSDLKELVNTAGELVAEFVLASVSALDVNASITFSTNLAGGDGLYVKLQRGSVEAASQEGLTMDGFFVPSGAFVEGSPRRLQQCSGDLAVYQVEWVGINPYHWAPPDLGFNALVASNADVKVVDVRHCGSSLQVLGAASPLQIVMRIRSGQVAPSGYSLHPRCVFFNESTVSWTGEGVSVAEPADFRTGAVTCFSFNGFGAYTAFLETITLPSTTTVTTITWGCKGDVPHQDFAGAWKCTADPTRDARVCTAACSGTAVEVKATCTNGTWTAESSCPSPDGPQEPQEGPSTSAALAWSSLAVVAFIVAAVSIFFWRRKQTVKGTRSPSVRSLGTPESQFTAMLEEDQEDLPIMETEPNFWDWATRRMDKVPSFSSLSGGRFVPPPPTLPLGSSKNPPAPDEPYPGTSPKSRGPVGASSWAQMLEDEPSLRQSTAVEVEVDPSFWDWATGWAQASPDLKPPSRSSGRASKRVGLPPLPNKQTQVVRQRPPAVNFNAASWNQLLTEGPPAGLKRPPPPPQQGGGRPGHQGREPPLPRQVGVPPPLPTGLPSHLAPEWQTLSPAPASGNPPPPPSRTPANWC